MFLLLHRPPWGGLILPQPGAPSPVLTRGWASQWFFSSVLFTFAFCFTEQQLKGQNEKQFSGSSTRKLNRNLTLVAATLQQVRLDSHGTSCMSLHLSEPQFFHLQNGYDDVIHPTGMLKGSNETEIVCETQSDRSRKWACGYFLEGPPPAP